MGEMIQEAKAIGDLDMSQFHGVFFEEAAENLDTYEAMLLAVDVDAPDDEDLNAIFRAAHSIKGGAATFGFSDVTKLTHELETLLDRVRKHELALTTQMVDTLLASGDALRAQLAVHQSGGGQSPDVSDLVSTLKCVVRGESPVHAGTPNRAKAPVDESRTLELTLGPLKRPSAADDVAALFSEIPGLGTITAIESADSTVRKYVVTTKSSNSDLLDLFAFHVNKDEVTITEAVASPAANAAQTDAEQGYGFFVSLEDIQGSTAAAQAPATHADAPVATRKAEPQKLIADRQSSSSHDSTLRVGIEKVDQLINLVGELVITQAALSQRARDLDPVGHQQLIASLSDLERNTRDLQEAVMSIRMVPMSFVFNRFPRMLRDLAAKLGKGVELKTQGEATELDKGLIERITDPLTHLVRNSVDHGIERAEERIAKGKPANGTITLSASHQGGSILIEVKDDGRGLDRDKILAKARERGIPVSDNISDPEVWQLIFAPGFSTAEVVTDVSGRGVGMDVVKRNITSMGGTVELDSANGYGTRVSVRLPLTLAIMDGMSVAVGEEIYILPLGSVVESFQLKQEQIRSVGNGGRVVEVRNEYLPVVALDEMFNVTRFDWEKNSNIMVVVESEGSRLALLVDELVGQQQIVVKNLEANYRKVLHVSGATILGDGRVSLILDVNQMVKRNRA